MGSERAEGCLRQLRAMRKVKVAARREVRVEVGHNAGISSHCRGAPALGGLPHFTSCEWSNFASLCLIDYVYILCV